MPSCRLYLGTENGLRVGQLTADGFTETASAIPGNAVRAIDVLSTDPDDAFIGCGLRGEGLYRTTDGGETVECIGFEDRWVWGVMRDPTDPETLYVGTEPPMLYVSHDGGATFSAFDGIENLPSRSDWTFFHPPHYAGHVHGIALHPDRPETIVAGVEQGALIISQDGGETWTDHVLGEGDVHRTAIDPHEPDRLYAGTGYGLFRSTDSGAEWDLVDDLADTYVHSIEFDPATAGRMYVYVAEGEDPLLVSEDAGETWQSLTGDLPHSRPSDNLCLHPTDPETILYAGDPDQDSSRLFVSTDRGASWMRLENEFPKIWRLAAVEATGAASR